MSDANDMLERLLSALNGHDLEAFVGCFAQDYVSEHPGLPDLSFTGTDRVRENWREKLSPGSDFRADAVRWVERDGVLWVEWQWSGTRPAGSPLDERLVCLYGVEGDRIRWARLY